MACSRRRRRSAAVSPRAALPAARARLQWMPACCTVGPASAAPIATPPALALTSHVYASVSAPAGASHQAGGRPRSCWARRQVPRGSATLRALRASPRPEAGRRRRRRCRSATGSGGRASSSTRGRRNRGRPTMLLLDSIASSRPAAEASPSAVARAGTATSRTPMTAPVHASVSTSTCIPGAPRAPSEPVRSPGRPVVERDAGALAKPTVPTSPLTPETTRIAVGEATASSNDAASGPAMKIRSSSRAWSA
jgi:hypothetical protein